MLKKNKHNKDKEKNANSKSKRILNIYSSNSSIYETQAHKSSSKILKRESERHSISNLMKPKKSVKKSKSKKKIVPNRKGKKQIENYQKVPLNSIQSNTNSEIQFSNLEESKQEKGNDKSKKILYIDCSDEYLIRESRRIEFLENKKTHKIKNDSATKIQKVFRGYLTRKLLMKYIEQEQKKIERYFHQQNGSHYVSKNYHGSCPMTSIEQGSQSKKRSYFQQIDTKKRTVNFFPSPTKHKKFSQQNQQQQSEQIYNPLEMESSIMQNQYQPYSSVNESNLSLGFQPKREKVQYLEERQKSSQDLSSEQKEMKEISLSFGCDFHNSPEFQQKKVKTDQPSSEEAQIQVQKVEKENIKTQISEQRQDYSIKYFNTNSQQITQQRQQQSQDHRSYHTAQDYSERQIKDNTLQRLKGMEKQKWEEMISLLSSHLDENSRSTQDFMTQILRISVKNKQELCVNSMIDMTDRLTVTPSTITNRQQEHEHHNVSDNLMDFKKKKRQIIEYQEEEEIPKIITDINEEKVRKNENFPLKYRCKEQKSLMEKTENVKQYILKNMKIQDDHVEQLIELRQLALKQKQSAKLMQLNTKLQGNDISQQAFISELSSLTIECQNNKQKIDGMRNEIYQGYKAQMELMKMTAIDAKKLGYKIPFCRSMELYGENGEWRFDDVIIDQLAKYQQKKVKKQGQLEIHEQVVNPAIVGIKEEEQEGSQKQSFNESDSVDFQFPQTQIYNKKYTVPYSFDITSLRNQVQQQPIQIKCNKVSIPPFIHNNFSQYKENQESYTPRNLKAQEDNCGRGELRKEVYEIQCESEEEILYREEESEQVNQVSQDIYNRLLWQLLSDIFTTKKFKDYIFPQKNTLQNLKPITNLQCLSFVDLATQMLPPFAQVKSKLNQKMYPNLKELLISMRQPDFDGGEECEEMEEVQYYQIGQYEYMFNQELCYNVISKYLNMQKQKQVQTQKSDRFHTAIKTRKLKQDLKLYGNKKIQVKIKERQNIHQKIQKQNLQLQQQISKIQMHVIMDSWNEQIIKYRQNKQGYSGIGLNELRMAINCRQCKMMDNEEKYKEMMGFTRSRIVEVLSQVQPINDKILQQSRQELCDNDYQWILYTHEALEIYFDITNTIQIQIYFEVAEELLQEKKKSTIRRNLHYEDSLDENSDSFENSDNEEEYERKIEQMAQKYRKENCQNSDYDSFYD